MKTIRFSAGLALLALVLAVLALPSCRGLGGGRSASISETSRVFTTYPFGDPDPVPIFARSSMWGGGARLYPYFFFNKFSGRGEAMEWPVVRLENPHISVSVLPAVGGKVWGAVEKATDREFLYTNHVMKFREIALRGPWTSGGIEFNFGIVGHAPTTATPVDYVLRKEPDGSVACVVGAMDLPSRTRWSVTIRLPKDTAYFETNGAWHNPTPFSQSYYYWSCGAIRTADDLKYIFPGRWQIGHDYDTPLDPWPVDSRGRDLSWYRNNDFGGSKSYFTVGEREDFYGAWYETSDTGMGHWAAYDDLPGRKVWIWELSRAGQIWIDLLTDSDGQYSEPQAGRLLNQSDHEFLRPGAADRWRELWFPYRGIGPMAKASPAGVLSASTGPGGLAVGLYPLREIDDDLVVTSGGRELHRERLTLPAALPFRKDLPVDVKDGTFRIAIGESLVYDSDPKATDLERPLRFKPVDESTAEGLFLGGARLEKARYYEPALEKYLACLKKEPTHLRALARVAELFARRGENDRGLLFAARALEEDMYDPASNYIYGTLARRLGKTVDAMETLGWAARSGEFRAAACVQLAEIALAEGAPERAVEYARKAIDSSAYASNAHEVLAAALRTAGRPAEARDALKRLLEFDPLDHLARFELHLLDGRAGSLDEFRRMIRNELPVETYLELALFYLRIGAPGDALKLLAAAPESPTVRTWTAYLLRDSDPRASREALDEAGAMSPRLVFPYREEEIPLFEWAIAARPDDWKPRYYLGLILWAKGRIGEARSLFARCDEADYAPFFLSRAMLNRDADPAAARADYFRAVGLDGASWRNRHALIEFLAGRGEKAEALRAAREAAGLFPSETAIQVDLVKALMSARLFAEAASVLDTVEALPFEGASEIHSLFSRTHLELGLAAIGERNWAAAARALEHSKEYPEKLGTGKPFDPDYRVQDYLLALLYGKLGEADKSQAAFKAVLEYTEAFPARGGQGAYAGAQALRWAGREADARAALTHVQAPDPALLAALSALR